MIKRLSGLYISHLESNLVKRRTNHVVIVIPQFPLTLVLFAGVANVRIKFFYMDDLNPIFCVVHLFIKSLRCSSPFLSTPHRMSATSFATAWPVKILNNLLNSKLGQKGSIKCLKAATMRNVFQVV